MAATPSTRLEPAARQALLATAATAIESGLARSIASPPDTRHLPQPLGDPRASFVTITIDRALRGCCGTLEPARPLLLDVWHNAQASAFHDPRFPPLTLAEWRLAEVEVSVLTPCERVVVASEQERLLGLAPGRDGLVLAWRGMRARPARQAITSGRRGSQRERATIQPPERAKSRSPWRSSSAPAMRTAMPWPNFRERP